MYSITMTSYEYFIFTQLYSIKGLLIDIVELNDRVNIAYASLPKFGLG